MIEIFSFSTFAKRCAVIRKLRLIYPRIYCVCRAFAITTFARSLTNFKNQFTFLQITYDFSISEWINRKNVNVIFFKCKKEKQGELWRGSRRKCLVVLVLREQASTQVTAQLRILEFYKGCKDHKFVYMCYFVCHSQSKCDLKARLVRNASSYSFMSVTFHGYCNCSFFSSSNDAQFLYFQFRRFIVALAAKYKHSYSGVRESCAILNIRELKRGSH